LKAKAYTVFKNLTLTICHDIFLAMDLIKALRNTCQKLKGAVKYNKFRKRSLVLDTVARYAGSCFAPEQFKRRNILEYFEEYKCEIFVETGTYYGVTTEFMIPYAKEIHTIELSKKLYKKCENKFKSEDKVHCYLGNSKDLLSGIIKKINGKPLFYLDSHYSGNGTAKADKNTPIIEELNILASSNIGPMVILIDDARFFGFEEDYPSLFKLKLFVKNNFKNPEFDVYNDVIRIVIN